MIKCVYGVCPKSRTSRIVGNSLMHILSYLEYLEIPGLIFGYVQSRSRSMFGYTESLKLPNYTYLVTSEELAALLGCPSFFPDLISWGARPSNQGGGPSYEVSVVAHQRSNLSVSKHETLGNANLGFKKKWLINLGLSSKK